ncbi:aldo/keto reductase [Anaerococcus prevotii]|uniref:Putative 2,5-diketo-D-gluconic acid reductase A n=1 Tax=Anaerococcus prevotii ACS-065-V-Col13 TaxID=879305 RepID=F0GT96_9FIRM|nr:aldo/keto reductase [Anaerococcus prevotii]EGC82942.1 putative 2,5-diketo-D-gluconic acid reductase A [Anaerococcus prevotii ACS-065-V-Col13]
MKYITLNDGIKVPAMGLGTYKIEDEKTMDEVINAALDFGYEYIDTAKFYNNEEFIGKALKNSSKKRSEYMLATKVWPSDFGADKTKRSIDESLKKLDTDYIDVIHLHWFGEDFDKSWKVFMDYKDQGIVKSIAVCNFMPEQLAKLFEVGEKPSMDQLESHLYLQDPETINFLKENNITHQAWSPLARTQGGILEEEILNKLADKYNKTPAQIALRWHIDRGTMIIPKSVHKERLKENIDIFDIELDESDLNSLASLDKKKRFSGDPLDQEWLEKARNM